MSSLDTSKDFLKHVFNMNDDSKSDMMNIVQYALLSVSPVVLLNKTMSKYVPEADESKGSVEIGAEVVLQVIVMFIGLLLIHRINTFIPTFSGEKYPEFNIVYIILAVLMITLSLQTKLGEKVSILSDRVMQLWEGREGLTSQPAKAGNNNVKVSQPLAQQQQQSSQLHANADNMAMNSTPISQLPMNTPPTSQTTTTANNMMANNVQSNQMQLPMQEEFEPVAANDGSGMFSSW
jgi:hypothetical protein|uniref:Uncharacterized protein n=1 Tax=viral metagenome TaxID=1070528 RepID=A0A6C0ILP7_9ZZZZ